MCAKYDVVFLELICSGDITNVTVIEKHLHKALNATYRGDVLSTQSVKAHKYKPTQKPLMRGVRCSGLIYNLSLAVRTGVSAWISLIMVQNHWTRL